MPSFVALRRAAVLVCLAFVGPIVSAAGQRPLTVDSLIAIGTQTRLIASAIRNFVVEDRDILQPQARELVGAYHDHNDDHCEYLQGKPEMCEDYIAQGHLLDARREKLQKQLKTADSTTQELEVRYVLLMDHLKTASFAPAVAGLRSAVVACAGLTAPSDGYACLARTIPELSRRGAGSGGR